MEQINKIYPSTTELNELLDVYKRDSQTLYNSRLLDSYDWAYEDKALRLWLPTESAPESVYGDMSIVGELDGDLDPLCGWIRTPGHSLEQCMHSLVSYRPKIRIRPPQGKKFKALWDNVTNNVDRILAGGPGEDVFNSSIYDGCGNLVFSHVLAAKKPESSVERKLFGAPGATSIVDIFHWNIDKDMMLELFAGDKYYCYGLPLIAANGNVVSANDVDRLGKGALVRLEFFFVKWISPPMPEQVVREQLVKIHLLAPPGYHSRTKKAAVKKLPSNRPQRSTATKPKKLVLPAYRKASRRSQKLPSTVIRSVDLNKL